MSTAQIEVIKRRGAKPRWRLRDGGDARFAAVKLGRVRLPPTTDENRRVRDAVDNVLTGMAKSARDDVAGA